MKTKSNKEIVDNGNDTFTVTFPTTTFTSGPTIMPKAMIIDSITRCAAEGHIGGCQCFISKEDWSEYNISLTT